MTEVASIIKYEGRNDCFIWKHPLEDFNTHTQLIVHESQEAIFMLNGQALDLFGPGRHTLETQNLPLLNKLFKRVTGDQSPFHCEVYFVNKTLQMAIKWGTDSRVKYIEPNYNFPISIGASGEMAIKLKDSRKVLVNIVGTETELSQANLVQQFRAFIMTRVKSYLAKTIKENKINIFEIDENLNLLSDGLLKMIKPDFDDLGVGLERFLVTTIATPDGEAAFERFKSLHQRKYLDLEEARLQKEKAIIEEEARATQTVIASQAQAIKRAQEGYTYQQERGFDVAGLVAQNEATGQFTNLGVGLGTMAGIGGSVAGIMGGAIRNATEGDTQKQIQCDNCGQAVPSTSKFCPNCGKGIVKVEKNSMICPACGKTVPKSKFCFECGKPLSLVCPKCGEAINGGKFCPNCGEKL